MNFFVAGLPRSRTAWLSVFLSQGRPCLHDGFNHCYSMAEYLEKLGDNGDSSTALSYVNINQMFPNAPIVIIDKTDEEFERCVEWCDKTFNMDSRDKLEEAREFLRGVSGMRVNQSEIDDNLEEIFTYLTGCQWESRYSELTKLNIQASPDDINYEASDSFFTELLG